MLGWSIDVKYNNGVTQYYSLSSDFSLDHKIRDAAMVIVDCPEFDIPNTEYKWFRGCGYPNRYLIRNDRLWLPIDSYYSDNHRIPCPVDSEQRKLLNFRDDQIFLVELWDQS